MNDNLVPAELIENKIYLIRGQKGMMDSDLARLYGIETKVLNQAVQRNFERFPPDFMFQLSDEELLNLRSQFVTSSLLNYGGRRYNPYVFTEQGVAMLSSILRSKRAVQVNIAIMRTFTHLRRLISTHKHLAEKLAQLEQKYDHQFKVVFEAIQQMMEDDSTNKPPIGFQSS